jgi:hypothetical protein
LQGGELVLVFGDPGKEVLHLVACFVHRRGVEASIEHLVEGVAVDPETGASAVARRGVVRNTG